MDYCNGGDLASKLSSLTRFEEPDARKTIKEALLALQHLHTHKIVHRDLKLENILVNNDDIKLIDFGISMLLKENN